MAVLVAIGLILAGLFMVDAGPGFIVGNKFYVQVDDDGGVGIGGATVRFLGDESYVGTTGPGGRAEFSGFVSGDYACTVSKVDVGTWTGRVTVNTEAGASVDKGFTVVIGGADPGPVLPDVYGYVRDSAGRGIAGAAVAMSSRTASTDSNGYYRFNAVAAGTYAVRASMSGYVSGTVSVTVGVSNVLVDTFTLASELYRTTFRVMDNDNTGELFVEGAVVTLGNGASGTTNGMGKASFSLGPGTYTYSVTADGFPSASGSITSSAATDRQTIDVILEGSIDQTTDQTTYYIVTGQVTIGDDVGLPISGAVVTVGSYSAITDEEGEYELSVPAGTYSYGITATGFVTASGSVVVDGDTTLGAALASAQDDDDDDDHEDDGETADYSLTQYAILAAPFILAAVILYFVIRRR